MVDKPAPREEPRIATNLLLRAALLLSPGADVSTRLTGIVTSARRKRALGTTNESELQHQLIVALERGVVHNDWTL
jgi:hypothetical protein